MFHIKLNNKLKGRVIVEQESFPAAEFVDKIVFFRLHEDQCKELGLEFGKKYIKAKGNPEGWEVEITRDEDGKEMHVVYDINDLPEGCIIGFIK